MADDRRIHVWQHCHHCGVAPIVGRRFDCEDCPAGPDRHLCEACHQLFLGGKVAHPTGAHAVVTTRIGTHVFVPVAGVSPVRYESWRDVPDVSVAPPRVPDRMVVRPEFRSGSIATVGSYAFVIDPGEGASRLLVTALHVLDELIKTIAVDRWRTAAIDRELPTLIDRVCLYDVFAPKWMFADIGFASSMLPLRDTRLDEDEPHCQGDMAAFVVAPSTPVAAAPLAAVPPGVGEPVWLAASTGVGTSARTRVAVVVERTDRSWIYRFLAREEGPRFTSGAPLLNRAGEVAGINIGGGLFEGRRYGHAVHVGSMRRHLASWRAASGSTAGLVTGNA
jgi:hypothetical protein